MEKEEEDGWKWDEEEMVEQESRESACRLITRRRGLFPSDFLGQAAASAGPLSVRE